VKEGLIDSFIHTRTSHGARKLDAGVEGCQVRSLTIFLNSTKVDSRTSPAKNAWGCCGSAVSGVNVVESVILRDLSLGSKERLVQAIYIEYI
jgi:hypothetical protein